MPKSEYNDEIVYELRTRLWATAYKFARELRQGGQGKTTVSALELLAALHEMIEETHHHWVEDKKKWNDILKSDY